MLDSQKVKSDFPILNKNVDGAPLVYLDNAATSQKPTQVIDAISNFYKNHNANVHRGIYTLSEEATDMYEAARAKVAKFINANSPQEIVFTGNTTHSINLVAYGWLINNLEPGDNVIASKSEHHSNFVPWQQAVKAKGATLELLDFDENGQISLHQLEQKINSKTKAVAVSHSSNVTGAVFTVKKIAEIAHNNGAKLIVDGAQAAGHMPVNVRELNCDFYAFSSHKMLGPMGVGVLWAKKELLEQTQPNFFGGGMIDIVSSQKTTWAQIPERFEAGTPNVSGAVGLAAAIDYLQDLGMENVLEHERELTSYALEKMSEIEGIRILGSNDPNNVENRAGLVSFVFDGIHSHDVASILSTKNICVRSGQHCTMPLHNELQISSSTRASFYIYNDKNDIDALVEGINYAVSLLKK